MAWLKNTDGTKSASFTMMIIAFSVVTLWLLLSIATKLGPVTIRPFSGGEAMAYLTPILALYWGRRQQEVSAKTITAAPTLPTATATDAPTCTCSCECCEQCEACRPSV